MFTIVFWRNAAERAVKSFANGALVVLSGSAITNLFQANVELVLGGGLLSAVYSLLMSLGTNVLPTGNPDTASLVRAVVAVDPSPTAR